ncbi:MAG: inositol monophosphatase [Candidatus Heimdallarchaeota archaeon]|nr:MAG: inositol monophosphatase [Candidatus Heimdallarchaeota archaeon]
MNCMKQRFLDVATESAKKAGKILLEFYKKKPEITYKEDQSIVSEADLKADSIIKIQLERNFPDHSILSEESGEKMQESEYLWIIDPLDGSTNFSVHNPFFAVSIGLLHKLQPILGVIFSPIQNELFIAERNKGARLNNQLISVNKDATLDTSFLAFCNGRDLHSRQNMAKIFYELKLKNNYIRQVGAAALELCYVAAGRFGGFFMTGVNPWDVVAGALIVEEASGTVTDFTNNLFSVKSSDIIASSPSIHKPLLNIIQQALASKGGS